VTSSNTTKIAILRLKARIKAVEREQSRLDALVVNSGDTVAQNMRDDLTTQFTRQKNALQNELHLRVDADKLNEALVTIRDHESLKALLRKRYGEGFRISDLSADDRKDYGKSLATRAKALEAVSLNPNDPPTDLLKNLVKRRFAVKNQIEDLKNKYPEFYLDEADVGSPCIACDQKCVDIVAKNAINYDRAMRSKNAFSGKQTRGDTCALMSVQSILLERDGAAPDETAIFSRDMVDVGIDSGAYSITRGNIKGGTCDESAVMVEAGIPATLTYGPSPDDIAKNVEEGRAVIVAYDTRPVWEPDQTKWDPQPQGHAVRVTGVERDFLGNVSAFYINDSGDGIAGKRVDIDTFRRAMDWKDDKGNLISRMSVSDQPIFEKFE